METTRLVLTEEEREVLILAALHPSGKHISNREIGQRLGIPVTRVKSLIHQACIKLEAGNRNQAIYLALRRGEISMDECVLLDELAEMLSSLGPDTLRDIAHLVRQEEGHGHLPGRDEQTIQAERREEGILTAKEREVLILASRGLGNLEIADRLCISVSAVRTSLYRVFEKLGARSRADAVKLALRQREIGVVELVSLDELAEILGSLGPDTLREIAQLVRQEEELGRLLGKDEQTTRTDRREDGILTPRERDVLILAGRGMGNLEIADRLCLSASAVKTFLHRAFKKLGAPRRADAVRLALKRREIGVDEISSPDELLRFLLPLGADSIEGMAELLDEELGI